MVKWGIVATIKADTATILRFAAYHLELGAHRIYIYLDAPDPQAQAALRDHPKCRVVRCDDGYWDRHNNGKRPPMHQPRQTLNATRAYIRANELDWLMHMDVDEFLVAEGQIASYLAALPDDIQCARARPMELLAGGDPQVEAAFKTFIPAGKQREQVMATLYPTFGQHLKGGFLSHIAGKIFVRTGIKGLKFRIHNAFLDGETNPNHIEMPDIHLAISTRLIGRHGTATLPTAIMKGPTAPTSAPLVAATVAASQCTNFSLSSKKRKARTACAPSSTKSAPIPPPCARV